MNPLNKVDVIILSWNRTPETIAAIESALSQQGVDQRVLVVDQGSKPENLALLREVAARDSRVVLNELGKNVGVAEGRNIATRMGDAPCVVALDNDAIFGEDDSLARAARRLEAEPRLGAIAYRIRNFFTGVDDAVCWDYPGASPSKADQEFAVTRSIGAGHALRRTAFEAAGGYDAELFFGGEERDLSYRLLNLGYRMVYAPEFEILHKVDPEARVRWQDGRYYYTVRNTLYINYKFGNSIFSLLRATAAMTVKGFANGIGREALRGVRDAIRMATRVGAQRRAMPVYRLADDTRRYIYACERRGYETFASRVRRQFEKLPGSA